MFHELNNGLASRRGDHFSYAILRMADKQSLIRFRTQDQENGSFARFRVIPVTILVLRASGCKKIENWTEGQRCNS